MKVLAIDTSMQACSAAVNVCGDGNPGISGEFESRARGHAEALMPMIQRVMSKARLSYHDLDRIAVTSGPGTFTGVRIGIAAARGLSLACKAPVVSANALEVMAHQAKGDTADDAALVIAIDARRGELYVLMPGCELMLVEPTVAAAKISELGLFNLTIAGSGGAFIARAAGNRREHWKIIASDIQPDARSLAVMASELEILPGSVKPLYLRSPDARPQHGKALPRAGRPQ